MRSPGPGFAWVPRRPAGATPEPTVPSGPRRWPTAPGRPAQAPPQPQLEPGERESTREPEPERHGRGHRAKPGEQRGRAGRPYGRSRPGKAALLEGGRDGQHPPPADRGDDHERAPDHTILRDRAVPWIGLVTAGVVRHAAVISHHP